MNPLVAIRLECLRLASGDIAYDGGAIKPDMKAVLVIANEYEKHVRRGLRNDQLAGGCGCSGNAGSSDAQRKRQQLLHEDAKALLDKSLEPMTLVQLVTDYDLVFPQAAADRIDAKLKAYGLRRNITGEDVGKWVLTGKLPGSRGKAYTP